MPKNCEHGNDRRWVRHTGDTSNEIMHAYNQINA